MAVDGWHTVLVLGGIRSGRSTFAESLISADASVRYVVTASPGEGTASARTRGEAVGQPPVDWTVERLDTDPTSLVTLLAGAQPEQTLLVDDLGGWVAGVLGPDHRPTEDLAVGELVAAVRACPARLVLVSPEAGLAPVPAAPQERAFVDALGAANQALAEVCDAVVLVVAGQPVWVKRPARRAEASEPVGETPPVTSPNVEQPAETWTAPTVALPIVATGMVIQPGMDLPLPDERAAADALDRLATLDLAGAGLGNLAPVVGFAAGTQGRPVPVPWRSVRVLLVHGVHEGGASAGAAPGDSARRADEARAGTGPLARLAAEVGASLQVVDVAAAAPIEHGPAMSATAVDSALRFGWRLAEEAVDDGVDVLVLASCGAGTEAAAAAVLAATAGAEPAAVLGRVITPGGQIDDAAWMTRCATVRDALHRTRRHAHGAKEVLAELGGGDVAVATGILLGAAARRTPVLLDGPLGVAAGLVSRDLAGQARHWCLLPDHGGDPGVRLGAEVLGLAPIFDLRLGLGEGMTALATLPTLRSALVLSAGVPVHPTLAGAVTGADVVAPTAVPGEDGPEFAEPQPAGPGPTAVHEPPASTESGGPTS